MVESIQSYLVENYRRLAADSENYFLVSCKDGKMDSEAIELTGAHVFSIGNGSTKNIAMGVILRDCRLGSEISRVAITAAHFKEMLSPRE